MDVLSLIVSFKRFPYESFPVGLSVASPEAVNWLKKCSQRWATASWARSTGIEQPHGTLIERGSFVAMSK